MGPWQEKLRALEELGDVLQLIRERNEAINLLLDWKITFADSDPEPQPGTWAAAVLAFLRRLDGKETP
jgi:hypothetical protein